jgi:flagellar hook-associated protein 3 FlgL
MRVTDASARYGSLAGLQSTASRLASLQTQLSSGKQITAPSDNPAGTARALQLRGDVKRNSQYMDNARDAVGWMSTSDAAYSQTVGLVQSARTLVVQGLNVGAGTAGSAGALADQIDAIRTSLLHVANSTYNGRPLFGGTTSGTVAYDTTGNYVGDSGTIGRAVGAQATVTINQTGPQVFGPAGGDLFTLLSNVSNNLRTNPSAASGQLAQLDSALARISAAQAAEGATYQQVQNIQTVQTANNASLTTQLSDLQDIDLADMAVRVSAATVTYQAALQTTANVRQMSLLSFLH